METKQTAVDWLVEQILVKFEDHMNDDYEFDFSKPPTLKFYNAFIDSTDLSEYVNKAKQMEKEQQGLTFARGSMTGYANANGYEGVDFEQYYNENYGN
jgi:hypothetical protein